MRHKLLVLTVKKMITIGVHLPHRSYRKIKTGVPLFGPLCRLSWIMSSSHAWRFVGGPQPLLPPQPRRLGVSAPRHRLHARRVHP